MLKAVGAKGTEQCPLEGVQQQGLEAGSCGQIFFFLLFLSGQEEKDDIILSYAVSLFVS